MVTLYGYGPLVGLPDGSPFVVKVMTLLRMANIDFKVDRNGYPKAPKGKLPYILDDGKLISDSTLIRFHIEKSRGIDFDSHLNPSEKATAWAFQKMCEEHLYWGILDLRWLVPDNFRKGPANYFKGVPGFIRPLIVKMVLRQVHKNAKGHGMGRHAREEIEMLSKRDLQAISDFLGDKKYFMGERISGVDATIHAFVSAAQAEAFSSSIRDFARSLPNLTAYTQRMHTQFFAKDQ